MWTDPEERDVVPGPITVSSVARYISSTFKGVASQPSIVEYCMYTVSQTHKFIFHEQMKGHAQKPYIHLYSQESPDYNPVIDKHPHHHNIIIAAGFSGIYYRETTIAL